MDTPREHEMESAANSYLMSLLAAMAGLPFPIINLVATVIFYLANRRNTYFVRWHCTQALVSQLPLFCTNSVLFWWTVRVVVGWTPLSSLYFAYLFTVVLFYGGAFQHHRLRGHHTHHDCRAPWPSGGMVCVRPAHPYTL